MKLSNVKTSLENEPTTVTAETTAIGLLLALNGAAREAEEDAAIDAAGILAQAEEANALDPVG